MTNVTVVTSGTWPPRRRRLPPGYIDDHQQLFGWQSHLGQRVQHHRIVERAEIRCWYDRGWRFRFLSNSTVAVFRAINAPATDQGVSQASKDFSFQYQVSVEIIPTGESPYFYTDRGATNLTAPAFTTNIPTQPGAGGGHYRIICMRYG